MLNRGIWLLAIGIALGVIACNIPGANFERVKMLLGGAAKAEAAQPKPAALQTVLAGAVVAPQQPVLDEIQMVKNAVPQGSTTTATVGEAFEDAFQNPKWSFFKTEKGIGVVQFRGNVKAGALNQAGFPWWPDTLAPGTEVARRAEALITRCGGSSSNLTPKVRSCFDSYAADLEIPVTFQFKLAADNQGFEIGEIDSTPWGWRTVHEQPYRIFQFIYN